MIDHTGLTASDFEKSKLFYLKALSPLGYTLLAEFPASVTGNSDVAGFGIAPKPDFWLASGETQKPRVHIAFRAQTRAQVDHFYQAAMASGGRDNGKPGPRPHYHENFYGAFVLDPDGHNIEAVCHEKE